LNTEPKKKQTAVPKHSPTQTSAYRGQGPQQWSDSAPSKPVQQHTGENCRRSGVSGKHTGLSGGTKHGDLPKSPGSPDIDQATPQTDHSTRALQPQTPLELTAPPPAATNATSSHSRGGNAPSRRLAMTGLELEVIPQGRDADSAPKEDQATVRSLC